MTLLLFWAAVVYYFWAPVLGLVLTIPRRVVYTTLAVVLIWKVVSL